MKDTKLSESESENNVTRNTQIAAINVYHDFLTDDECYLIIDECLKVSPELPSFQEDLSKLITRKMATNHDLMFNIVNRIWNVNDQVFKYDIKGIPDGEEINFLEYKTNDKYNWHNDLGSSELKCTRKISFSLQLSRSEDYEGGDLLFMPKIDIDVDIRKQGTLIIYPSWMTHCITPITSGTRYSVVSWVHGSSFR
jgi:predicted 2-oxoglutarate/Fe(II)-dependent dioxygenase YbiX